MIAAEFIDQVQKFNVASHVGVEDFADKFNFLITVLVLLLCTSIVTIKQYMMKPISCYMATDIGGKNLLDYVENYCWVQGTIPISHADNIPDTEERWLALNKEKILYYQWVPFVLGLQCILFYLPRIFWQMICYNNAGTDVEHIISLANDAVRADEKTRAGIIDNLAKTLTNLLHHYRNDKETKLGRIQRKIKNFCSIVFVNKKMGSFLYNMYMFVKILYLANCLGQIFLMERFLGYNSVNTTGTFGYQVAMNIAGGNDWEVTQIFPRVGFCVTKIRQLGSINFVAAQCVLPANMLNERIYVFLWFWFCICAAITIASIPIWIYRIKFEKSQTGFIKKYLLMTEDYNDQQKQMVKKFIKTFLRNDGLFLIRIIAMNAGEMICADIVKAIWNTYKMNYSRRDFSNPENDRPKNTLNKGQARKSSTAASLLGDVDAVSYKKETMKNEDFNFSKTKFRQT